MWGMEFGNMGFICIVDHWHFVLAVHLFVGVNKNIIVTILFPRTVAWMS